MFSVTYSGMKFRPVWTARVCPMKSGRMVERRDQVLMTFFSFLAFMLETFTIRWSSTNGPLCNEPPMLGYLSTLGLAADDHLVCPLVISGFESTPRLPPRGHRMASTLGLTSTTT